MAIGTYAQLQAAAIAWTHRSDLATQMPDFIKLCEDRLNDLLLLRSMETEDQLTATLNSSIIPLPSGYVSPIALWILLDTERRQLNPALPIELQFSPSSGYPKYWAIDNTNIRFDCPCQQAFVVPFRYVKRQNLSDANPTNALLTERSDIYLAGTIVEAARWMQSDRLMALWEPKFLASVAAKKAADARSRSIVPLRTDIPGTGRRANIIAGS